MSRDGTFIEYFMNDISIRPYSPTDYEAVCGLMTALQSHFANVDSLGESRAFTSNTDAKEYIDQGLKDIAEMQGASFVALDGEEVIGFVQGIIDTHAGQVMHTLGHHPSIDGWIGLLFVKDKYRNQGVGSALIAQMKAYFEKNGCSTMRLKVMSDNQDALNVYKKLGFTPKDIEMVRSL